MGRGKDRRLGSQPGHSIRTQGLVAIVVPTFFILAYVFAALALSHQNQRAESTLAAAEQVLSAEAQLRADTLQAQASGTSALLGTANGPSEFQAAFGAVPGDLSRLQSLVAGNSSAEALVKAISNDTNVLEADLSGYVTFPPSNPQVGGAEAAELDNADATLDRDLQALTEQEQQVVSAQEAAVSASSQRLEISGLVGVLVVGVGGTILSLIFTSRVVGRLRRLGDATETLALGEPTGDLPTGDDEIGLLALRLSQAADLLIEREGERDRARADLDDVLRNSPVVSLRYDAQSRSLVYVSPNVSRLLGITESEALTDMDAVSVRMHPDDRATIRRMLRGQRRHSGDRFELIVRVKPDPDATEWRYAETVITVNVDDEGELEDAVIYMVDVTDRLLAEREAEERRSLLESIFDASPDTITVRDAEGRELLSSVNGAHPVPALAGQVSADKITGEERELLDMLVRCASGETSPEPVIAPGIDLEGNPRIYETRARPVADRNGWVTGIVTVSRDITDRIELEESLRRASEEAEAASKAKSEFLSRMSHELRTPLNAILGFAQLLEMDELPPEQASSVGQIERAGKHLLSLINEVLDISRIEAGRLTLTLDAVNVADVLSETATLLAPVAEGHGVTLAVEAGATRSRYVHADRQRLLQVLINLGSNAIKYNHRGGRATFRTTLVGDDRIRFDVIDTGPGIPADKRDQLFQPFSRLGAESSGIEGTGVGLALSKQLVELMGGQIDVTSCESGSVFSVTLATTVAPGAEDWDEQEPDGASPLITSSDGASPVTSNGSSREQESELGTSPSDEAAAGSQEKYEATVSQTPRLVVLNIEDNPSNASLVEQVLSRRPGVSLLTTAQARLGLEMAKEHHPDLVLLDLHLPDLPGDELFHRLKTDPDLADVKVVVVSADATPGRIRRMLSQGVEGYLTKPIDVEALLRLVDGELETKAGT